MPFLPKGFEWIIILIVVIIIFGPKAFPKLGASLGKAVKNLRAGMKSSKSDKQIPQSAADKAAANLEAADKAIAQLESGADAAEARVKLAEESAQAATEAVNAKTVKFKDEAEEVVQDAVADAVEVTEAAQEAVSDVAADVAGDVKEVAGDVAQATDAAQQAAPRVVKKVVKKKVD